MQVACEVGRKRGGGGEGFAWCVARGGDTLLFIIGSSDYPPVRRTVQANKPQGKAKGGVLRPEKLFIIGCSDYSPVRKQFR